MRRISAQLAVFTATAIKSSERGLLFFQLRLAFNAQANAGNGLSPGIGHVALFLKNAARARIVAMILAAYQGLGNEIEQWFHELQKKEAIDEFLETAQ